MLDNASARPRSLNRQQLKNTNTAQAALIWFGGESSACSARTTTSTPPADELARSSTIWTRRHGHAKLRRCVSTEDGSLVRSNPARDARALGSLAIGRDFGIDYLQLIEKNHVLFSADGTMPSCSSSRDPGAVVLTGRTAALASDVALFGGSGAIRGHAAGIPACWNMKASCRRRERSGSSDRVEVSRSEVAPIAEGAQMLGASRCRVAPNKVDPAFGSRSQTNVVWRGRDVASNRT